MNKVIQWFPGHMTKALRMMESKIKLVDSVIYILDARAPLSSINKQFNTLVANKPILYVLNKADLVSESDLKAWVVWFESKGMTAIPCVSTVSGSANKITQALIRLNKDKLERQKAKGINGNVRAMVIGMPNTGKSTLINCLAGEKRAITGNRPGVTRGEQWVRIGNSGIALMDTPGTLCHSIETEDKALRLAYVGCIKDAILDINELALEFLEFLRAQYPTALLSRYKLEAPLPEGVELLEAICKKRGFVMKGGYDYDRGCGAVLDDFRKHKLGDIILEKPEEEV